MYAVQCTVQYTATVGSHARIVPLDSAGSLVRRVELS